jgi:hypothetical protein
MKSLSDARSPTSLQCELTIDGHLGERWSSWFDDLDLVHNADGTTTLRGPVADQAELHGLLNKIRDLGATLLSVEALCHKRHQDIGAAGGTVHVRLPANHPIDATVPGF